MTRKSAFLFAVLTLAASLTYVAPAGAREKDTLVGVAGQYIMYGNVRGDGATDRMVVPSSGASIVVDYSLLDYITLGGEFSYSAAYTEKTTQGVWDARYTPNLGISATMRTGYPFLEKKNLDVYIRWTAGYGIYNVHRTDIDHGWVAKAMPGIMYTGSNGLSVFVETGWAGGGYIDAADNHIFLSGLALNFGIGWVFR